MASFAASVTRLSGAVGMVVAWLMFSTVTIIAYEVFMRYALNRPTIWVHELTILLSAVGYLFAGAFTLSKRDHIRVSLLYDRQSPRVRTILDAVNHVAIAIFVATLAWAAHERALDAALELERTGTAWNPPLPAILYPLIVLAALLMLLQALANLAVDLSYLGGGRRDENGCTGGGGGQG